MRSSPGPIAVGCFQSLSFPRRAGLDGCVGLKHLVALDAFLNFQILVKANVGGMMLFDQHRQLSPSWTLRTRSRPCSSSSSRTVSIRPNTRRSPPVCWPDTGRVRGGVGYQRSHVAELGARSEKPRGAGPGTAADRSKTPTRAARESGCISLTFEPESSRRS